MLEIQDDPSAASLVSPSGLLLEGSSPVTPAWLSQGSTPSYLLQYKLQPPCAILTLEAGTNLLCVVQGADFLCDSDGVTELCAAVAKSTAVAHFPEGYAFPMTVQLQDGHYVEVSRETVTDCLCLHNGNVRPSLPAEV